MTDTLTLERPRTAYADVYADMPPLALEGFDMAPFWPAKHVARAVAFYCALDNGQPVDDVLLDHVTTFRVGYVADDFIQNQLRWLFTLPPHEGGKDNGWWARLYPKCTARVARRAYLYACKEWRAIAKTRPADEAGSWPQLPSRATARIALENAAVEQCKTRHAWADERMAERLALIAEHFADHGKT